MDGRVAAGGPATAEGQTRGVIPAADVNPPVRRRALNLRMAAETQVRIRHGQHLGVDRAMGIVAGRAAFAQRLMFEDERPALFAMALEAGLIAGRQ